MTNEFMKKWNPTTEKEDGDLVLSRDYGFGTSAKTSVHCSEGDTLFINQDSGLYNGTQRVSITREELYSLIYNFMNIDEIREVEEKMYDKYVEENLKK